MTSTRGTLWTAAPLAVGAIALAAAWSGPSGPAILLVGALLPLLVIGALLRLKLPAWLAAIAPAVVGGGVALALAAHASGVAPWHEIGRALRTLLAVPSPAHVTSVLILPGVILCVVVSSIVGVRLHVADRGRVAGVAGGVALYGGGQLLTAGTGDSHGLLAGALLATALLGWQFEGAAPVRSTASPGRVALIALVVIPALLLTIEGTGEGYQPRNHISQPRTVLKATEPLASLALWTSNPNVALFQATVTGTDRLHVATLDSYNGQAWQDDGSFVPLDQYAAPDLSPGSHRSPVTASVKLGQIGGPLLPTVSGAETVSNPAGLIDPSSGDTALVDSAVPGLTYSVTGTKPDPAPGSLASAAEPIVPAGYLNVPSPPAALLSFARDKTATATTPLQEAVALEAAVATGRTLKVIDPGGSSYSRLTTFLFRSAAEGGQEGNTEQFAAAFAVLCRLVGLPTRLVVGFELPENGTGQQQTITGADARAWPEVYLGGIGWLPFDPTPGAQTSADAAVRAQVLAATKTPSSTQSAVTPGPKAAPTQPAAPPAATVSHRVRDAAVIVILAVLLAFGLLIGRRLSRRRRRRRSGARGAWADVLDLRGRTGTPVTPGTSGTAIAESFGAITPQARELATLIVTAADHAAFAPGSSSGGSADEAAWQAVAELRREVRRNKPRRRPAPV